jgi:hypothetical protein
MPDSIDRRLAQIQRLLEAARSRLQAHAADLRAFDPDTEFSAEPGPCLTEARLAAYERRHRITLPAEHRAFLARVGNGGPGPDYGLLPLGHDAHMDKPFPFTKAWRDPRGLEAEPRAAHGTLFLVDVGCGIGWYLVVTGPERGHVWVLDEGGATPCSPPRDFLSWYGIWLESFLSGADWYAEVLGDANPFREDRSAAGPDHPAVDRDTGEGLPF